MIIKLSKLSWAFILALPLFFTACDNDDDSADPKSIVEIVAEDDDFSTLATALERADLLSVLEQQGTSYTVFAPNNAAFTASGVDIADFTDEELKPILLYHVLAGTKLNAADINEGKNYVSTASDTGPEQTQLSILVEKTGSAVKINNAVNVSTADVDASNGVIHIVDKVILPLDVVGHASANNDFTSLVTALGAAEGDLVTTLQTAGPFTVFAPVNSAFDAISDVTDGLSEAQLAKVLLYHVLSGNNVRSGLSEGSQETLNDGVSFTVNVNGDEVSITDAGGGVATVLLTDVQATNGVIHVLNAVLVPDNL